MDTPDTSTGFDELGLSPAIAKAVQELGYESPTAIQRQCIPHLLEGRDLLGQAQTGTGKTAAFALPLLSLIDPDLRRPQVLVLTPTRELALQVAEAFQGYARNLNSFNVLPIYGGQAYGLQLSQLKRNPQVIVGTPGRVMDHIRRGTLQLDGIRALVLDEADEMLNMGFAEDIDWIFDQAPAERQVALFSATMPPAIRRVAQNRLKDPVEVRIAADSETVDTIEQHHCVVTRFHKMDVLTRILELEPFDGMLIFVRTKNATTELADKLKAHGFAAEPLNGDMNQEMRERTVERLKQGQLDILVATDVAARGLDVERISHVVNYDIPTDPSAYVHRIGRTGRAGRAGRAILLVEPRERGLLRAIERIIRRSVPAMDPPSAAALTESRIDRFTQEILKTLTEQDLDFFYRLLARITQEQEVEMMDVAAALAYLGQRERPLDVKDDPIRPVRRDDRSDDRAGRGQRSDGRGRGRGADRDERRPRQDRERSGARPDDSDLVSYRIEVGHQHGATPREIVGAIANESGLEGRYIGRINIQNDHSVVDLPSGMPRDIFKHLKRVFVCGQALRISLLSEGANRGWAGRSDSDEGGFGSTGPRGKPPAFAKEGKPFKRKPRD
ncbi:DEAD/DEAH box helicase [Thiorhodococcus mannitoliphagus]|uniref:ATP-dependent RNA helicase DeaD n=1 Tax=Thiorhodococcus mannitoliphagus TaxID=329406 RepID=A0A6P1E3N4_9GAMM|nr:DEAD/DEAH box helicase [Thiorhodococcus mannitoliphagus]NEX22295.1 DEAD/DEAH box helicase [Thiorhodococcus mannitoliphagus]